MTAQQLRFIVPLCTVIALTCACSKPAADAVSATSNAFDQLVQTADKANAAANDAKPSGDALGPNERVQGTLQLDIGNGVATFRSIATKIPDDLGKTAAKRMGTAAGQNDLAGANAKIGGGANVTAQDVQELADAFAGKTVYTSQMHSIAIANMRQIELAGVAADGRKLTLHINFPMDSDTPTGAKLEYVPDGNKRMQSFETDRKDKGSVQVTLDRFERVDDKTLSIAGSFKATNLQPGVLAKDLAGQDIPNASGSFDFTEINIRPNS